MLTNLEVFFRSHKGRYGAPRIHAELQQQGAACSKGRVARLMRGAGLVSTYKKRKKPKARKAKAEDAFAPNLLAREFEAKQPGQRWVTDIKYIETMSGWAYLCVVLDLFGREVLGWSVQNYMEDSLVVEALQMAIERRGLQDDALVHSDRGGQYTSKLYQELLRECGVDCSMSRK